MGELLAAIAREEALIGRPEREREEAQARIQSLRAQLGAPTDAACSMSPLVPSTAAEKVALFRGLFRGRDDVFAKLWVNPRTDTHPTYNTSLIGTANAAETGSPST